MDLFDIWQSAQQPFKDFEKEMCESEDIIKEPNYFYELGKSAKRNSEIYTADFLNFWELYNKSRNKPGTYKKWQKLTDLEKKEIMLTLPEYIEATPDKKFRKDPSTYINQKSWKDEVIKNDNSEYAVGDEQLKQIITNSFEP